MDPHMSMTKLRPLWPGDQARADAIVAAAKKAAERLNDAARDVKSQVQVMSERTGGLGGRRPPPGRRGRV